MASSAPSFVHYLHRELGPPALVTGGLMLIAATATLAIAFQRSDPHWRVAWVAAAWLALLLALDTALPLDRWTIHAIGRPWELPYAAPGAVGLAGWLSALPMLSRSGREPLRRPFTIWVIAVAARIAAAGVSHSHSGLSAVNDVLLAAEALLKLVGAAFAAFALIQIFIRIRSSQAARTISQPPFIGQQLHSKTVALAQGGSDPDDEAQERERAFPQRKRLSPQRGPRSPRDAHQEV